MREAAPGDAAKQVDRAYEIALSRAPTAQERKVAVDFLGQHQLEDFAHVILNLNEFLYLR